MVPVLRLVGDRKKWRLAVLVMLLCLGGVALGVVFWVQVARGVIPAEMSDTGRARSLHLLGMAAWTTGWAIGVILTFNAAVFYRWGNGRTRLVRMEGAWELSVPTQRRSAPIAVRDGQILQFGFRNVGMGERPSAKRRHVCIWAVDAEIPPPQARAGEVTPAAPRVEVFSHARLDELSIRDAIDAIESVGGRIVVAPEYAKLVVDR